MALVTFASLKQQARERSDMLYTNYVKDDELGRYINNSAQELYDILTGTYSDYYYEEYAFTVNNSNNNVALPSDFYQILGVDEVLSSNYNITVKPYQWLERNTYIKPINSHSVKLLYIPQMTVMVNDSDTFDGINGYEQYIVVDVARKMLQKEESDVSALLQEKAELKQRIESLATNRMAGDSNRIQDVTRVDNYYLYAAPNRLRYRIRGGNITFVESNFFGTVME